MKVTIVLATSTGGVGTHVSSLVQRLPAMGVEVAVAGPPATDERFGFAAEGAAFLPVAIPNRPRPLRDLSVVRALRAATAGSDIVHAHGLRAAMLTGLALGRRRRGRTPLVATWHNAVLATGAERRVLAGLERLAAVRADVTLGASPDLVQRAQRLGSRDARSCPVAAPPMPPPGRAPADVRAELGAGDGRPVILAVGRLAAQKDYDTLLAAAEVWARREPRPLVAVAGDGPDRDRLQRRIDGADLPVRLLGSRPDVPDLLAAADVYVLTSRWEARALVVQEAMAAGVPVVATAVGGIPELVGDAGRLVPPGDAGELAARVAELLDDAGLRAGFAERSRERAKTWPGEDDTARQVVGVYRELTGGS